MDWGKCGKSYVNQNDTSGFSFIPSDHYGINGVNVVGMKLMCRIPELYVMVFASVLKKSKIHLRALVKSTCSWYDLITWTDLCYHSPLSKA